MLLAWNSKFGPRARWSDSSHSREPMDSMPPPATRLIGDGPPLLMYSPGGFNGHGGEVEHTGRVRAHQAARPPAEKKYRCIVFDRRETGQSGGRVEVLTWQRYVAQGKGLLEHLEHRRACIFMGALHGRGARWWRSQVENTRRWSRAWCFTGRWGERSTASTTISASQNHIDYAERHSLADVGGARAASSGKTVRRGSARRTRGLPCCGATRAFAEAFAAV